MKLHPPWTDEQVRKLNEWQMCDWVHPFTCAGERHDEVHLRRAHLLNQEPGLLIATPGGWQCQACGYRQTWAHDFMFKGAPPRPQLGDRK